MEISRKLGELCPLAGAAERAPRAGDTSGRLRAPRLPEDGRGQRPPAPPPGAKRTAPRPGPPSARPSVAPPAPACGARTSLRHRRTRGRTPGRVVGFRGWPWRLLPGCFNGPRDRVGPPASTPVPPSQSRSPSRLRAPVIFPFPRTGPSPAAAGASSQEGQSREPPAGSSALLLGLVAPQPPHGNRSWPGGSAGLWWQNKEIHVKGQA